MAQPNKTKPNQLHDLGYKIFLDRYAQKDMTRDSLVVDDIVIVVVNGDTGQREVGKVTKIDLPTVTIKLTDGDVVERDIENVDKPLETDPAQMMARVARGVAEIEKSDELREQWSEQFRWLLQDWKFVPGGRILAAAGTDQELTFYNCMPPEQEILTKEGYRPIADVRIGDYVVTHKNRLRKVLHKFERETEESIYTIKAKKLGYDDLRVTGEHKILVIRSEWVNSHRDRDGLRLKQEPQWIPAKYLKPSDFVAVAFDGERREQKNIYISDYIGIDALTEQDTQFPETAIVSAHSAYEVEGDKLIKATTYADGRTITGKRPLPLNNELVLDEDLNYLFGRWLGDGCITHRTGTDIPSGIKIVFSLEELADAEEIASIIEAKFGISADIKLSSTTRWYDLWVNSMSVGEFFKSFLGYYSHSKVMPEVLMRLSDTNTLALLRGLFRADGYISKNKLGMLLSNRTLTTQVHQLLLRLGYFFSINENTHKNGRTPAYRVEAAANECAPLFEAFFDQEAPSYDIDLKYYLEYDDLRWVRIGSIEIEDYQGLVLDIEVEEDHSFISAGVVVSNCYVLPSPHDSREGIMQTLTHMTEIMSRGGGVGLNISTLRPRHSYVKGVNGRSSGSVSWGALYSFVTGLIEQGGCFGPNERIATNKGLIPAEELADRMDEGETFLAHTHKGLRDITARFRNGIKPLYEVTTDRGYKVRITEDHKVAVLMDGNVTTMALKYLQEGDEILLLLSEGSDSDYVEIESVEYERSIMSTTLNTDVTLPKYLNEDLAYFLGYSTGDGYVHIGKKVTWEGAKALKLATADTHPSIRERLVDITGQQFNLSPTIEPADGACANVAVYSRILIEWLSHNGLLKAKSKDIRVPELIFRSPPSVQLAYIAGYFDADGCNRKRKGGYGFDSISREMLEDVQIILAANGIVSRLHTHERKPKNWNTIYRLTVTGNTFRSRFAEIVPAEKVGSSNGKRDMYNTYPADVWNAIGERSKYRQRIYDGQSERISSNQLVKISERLIEDNRLESAEHIQDLLHTLPDTISSITLLDDSEVYDFEVEDVHLLSGNGVYTSNSRRGALMLILNDWHPDVFDFINSKRQAGQITNANISVGVSDQLMEAVKNDGDWDLLFPDSSDPDYDTLWDGDLDTWKAAGHKVVHYKTIKARELWDAIIESAWASAEPGVWFRERSNKMANSWYFNPLISTNPCVTGDTRLHTDKGMVQMRELFDEETDIQVALDGRFGVDKTLTPSTRVFMTGVKQVYRMQTKEGYFVRATADHRFMTPRGWVELQDMKAGDKIHIMNRKGGFGQEGSLELGRVLGWLVGDGTIKADRAVLSFFGDEKQELAPMFAEHVNQIVAPMTTHRTYEVGVVDIKGRDEARVRSLRLRHLTEEYGLVENKHQVPEIVFKGTEDMQRGYLQGLFTADGSAQQTTSKAAVIRLASSEYELLEQVQQLLGNFGIACRIFKNRRKASYRMMPDGKGGSKEYWTQANHEIHIAKANVVQFQKEIGFLMDYKNEAIEQYLSEYKVGPRAENFVAVVESITEDGVEEVFDVTVPITHSFVGNSIILHNCGEQPLGAWSVCNLGALNLSRFYDEKNNDADWAELDKAVRVATRFLDNVIDTTPYFFQENEDMQLSERRVGLGTMGIAELMLDCGIRYGSDESVEFIEKVYKAIAVASYETSAELASEKGAFPMFDAEKYLESGFMQQMPDSVRESIREKGARNVTLLTQAPTGCVAPDTLVSAVDGLTPIIEMGNPKGEQWQIMPRDVHTDEGIRKASHFYINGTQAVKRITSNRGFTITATHNHRIRVIDQAGDYVWRRMDELAQGDKVVLKRSTLTNNSEVRLKAVEQASNAKSALPEVMTSDFAELLGLYMGDGYTKKRGGLHIVVAHQDSDLLDYVKDLLQKVWGERHIGVEDRIGCSVASLTGYYIPRFFKANNLKKPSGNEGQGAAGAFIPVKVLQAGRDAVIAFLRGLFEADGCVHRGTITLSSTSQKMAQQVQVALLGLGIVSTIREMPEQEDRYGSRPIYELRMLNRREAQRFVEIVGFISERKREIAKDLGTLSDRGDNISVSPLLDEFYAESQGLPNVVRQKIVGRVSNGAVTQQFVKDVVAENTMLEETRLARLVDLDVFVDEIANIEDAVCDTYDISVPDNHTYIANGFVSHNTTGTMVNTSTGIEPFFSWVYYRKGRLGLHEEKVPIVARYFEENPDETELPDYFVTAMDLAPEEHVKVQGAFQRWIDSAISKTCNVPNEYTVEQVSELYEMMYDLGCKGGTIYRDGSRSEQVLMLKKEEEEPEKVANVEILPKEEKQVTTPHRVYPRPSVLNGTTVRFNTPFGKSYITMNSDEFGNPFEVFITVGKAGSDIQADAEALGRMISLQLRTTAPNNRRDMLKLVVEQLSDIGGARPMGFGPNRILSLPDAVGRALMIHYINEPEPQQLGLPINGVPAVSAPAKTEEKPLENKFKSGADMCPECGTISLIRAEGCRKCLTCGYSEC